jgi:hypothetical protein
MSTYTETKTHGQQAHQHKAHGHGPGHSHGGGEQCPCDVAPEFVRLKYFYGQMLGAHDFQTEQDFFREKSRLHNRCLHGYGVVCGLRVVGEPREEPCEPEGTDERDRLEQEFKEVEQAIKDAPQSDTPPDEVKRLHERREELLRRLEELGKEHCEDETPTRVRVECGLALDCAGNELVVRCPLSVDLWKALGRQEQDALDPDGATLYVSLCFCEQPVAPTRPVVADACGATPDCVYGKVREGVRVRVSATAPDEDERCEACCTRCQAQPAGGCDPEPPPCVLLARVDNFRRGRPLAPEDIHNEVRRPVSLYVPTTITGVSWTHGATYTEDEASSLVNLMEVRFSRPVRASTIRPGVVDLWGITGGMTRSGGIYSLEVEYVDLPPPDQMTQTLKFRYAGDEDLDPGDRLLIIVRAGFILDKCCRPVSGGHAGGRVPFIDEDPYRDFDRREQEGVADDNCVYPPPGFGPWATGAGDTFESWIYVPRDEGKNYAKKPRTQEGS